MAYEVTKVVKGRSYRYGVRSERDAATGKTRNRWTYLGRVDAGRSAAVTAKPRRNAREVLLNALERLLDRSDVGDVTAAAVSIEAGLAHGTFYRYFRNRDDAINALTERVRESSALEFGALDLPPAGAADARAALRTWSAALLRTRMAHHGIIRAFLAVAAQDDAKWIALRARRERYARRFADWLHDLAQRGIVTLAAPELSAAVLFAMLDGVGREAIGTAEPLDESHVMVAVDLIERAVFGVPVSV